MSAVLELLEREVVSPAEWDAQPELSVIVTNDAGTPELVVFPVPESVWLAADAHNVPLMAIDVVKAVAMYRLPSDLSVLGVAIRTECWTLSEDATPEQLAAHDAGRPIAAIPGAREERCFTAAMLDESIIVVCATRQPDDSAGLRFSERVPRDSEDSVGGRMVDSLRLFLEAVHSVRRI